MKATASGIRDEVAGSSAKMKQMDQADVTVKPRPEKWSKQEILGHLIDSAVNNYHRFVRAQHGAAEDFPCYRQDDWVAAQRYNERDWPDLVALWGGLNLHLAHIIDRIPESSGDAPVNFNEDQPARLDYVVGDYLEHMRHHLRQILAE
jgi:hypothetical protein